MTLAQASDTGISRTDGNTNASRPTLTGSAEAGSTVTLYSGTTALGSGLAGSDGVFNIQLTSALADGTYSITARASDAAGNSSAASTGKSVVIDTVAPTSTADIGKFGTQRYSDNISPTADTIHGGANAVPGGAGLYVVAEQASGSLIGGRYTSGAVLSNESVDAWALADAKSTVAYKFQVMDVAGNLGPFSASVTYSASK